MLKQLFKNYEFLFYLVIFDDLTGNKFATLIPKTKCRNFQPVYLKSTYNSRKILVIVIAIIITEIV